MLSDRLIDFLGEQVKAGFDENRVWELFDFYVALYVDGDLDELESELENHRAKFTRFLQHNIENLASPKRLTPFKKQDQTERQSDGLGNSALSEEAGFDFTQALSTISDTESITVEHLQMMQENAMMPLTEEENRMDDLSLALWKVFGMTGFRESQEEIVQSILAGHDCFVLMPTGGGKSLCYQLPAVMSQGVTVVVSPLLSLVQDQVRTLITLSSGGIPATYLSSSQTVIEKRAVYREISKEELTCKLLYVTPEQLTCNKGLIEILQRQQRHQNFCRMVIDEAHCVSMWGHDFRPAYLDLGRAKREFFPGLQTVALTATANRKVKENIIESLGMTSTVKEFQRSFYRSNLKFIVVKKTHFHAAMVMLEKYIRHNRGASGIVYCLSKKECEEVAQLLNSFKISAAHYHAGMTAVERETVQNKWKNKETDVVVATIAFGMGIDHPHVRYVIHFVLPKSLENYYQEAGRAGRDGLRSECVLLYSGKDVGRLKLLIRRNNPDYKKGYELIEQVKDYCINETDCRHRLILAYLDEQMEPSSCSSNCHICCSHTQGISLTEQCPWSIVTDQDIAKAKARAEKHIQPNAEGYPY